LRNILHFLLLASTLVASQARSGEIVSNLSESYDFSAGIGAYIQASSFTTGPGSHRLDSITISLGVDAPGTVGLAVVSSDALGWPGALLESVGARFVERGSGPAVYPASGITILQPNTKYWLLVEQTAGDPNNNNVKLISWESTFSTTESSPVGVTIGADMYYRPIGGLGIWSPHEFATDAGKFAINATSATADTDLDGVLDIADNCTLESNASQCDSDSDGYGNRCDGDMNNTGATNAQDTVLFRQQLGQPSLAPAFNEADLNCNGTVNAQDTTLYRQLLGVPPGPSGTAP
jgi:Thrombospondin type 3 repeat